MTGLVLATIVLAVTCLVLLLAMRGQLYNRHDGTVPTVRSLVGQCAEIRTALRGAGIAVDADDEDTGTGRHAAKGTVSQGDQTDPARPS